MGERAYFIERVGSEWKAIYSHWGAGDLFRWLEDDFREALERANEKGKIDRGEYMGAVERFKTFYKHSIDYELDKGETWEKVEDLSEFIDLTDITTEAYIINNDGEFYIILVFVNQRIHGGIISRVFDDAHENWKTRWIFEYFKNVTKFFDKSFKELNDSKIKTEIKSDFHKRYFEPACERWLNFDKVDSTIMNLITGKAVFLL